MGLAYISKTYRVPAKRGTKVIYAGRAGTITSSIGGNIRVRFDDNRRRVIVHPTDEKLVYVQLALGEIVGVVKQIVDELPTFQRALAELLETL